MALTFSQRARKATNDRWTRIRTISAILNKANINASNRKISTFHSHCRDLWEAIEEAAKSGDNREASKKVIARWNDMADKIILPRRRSRVKSQTRRRVARTVPVTSVTSRTNGQSGDVSLLYAAKEFVQKVGGIANASQAISMFQELFS